MVPGQAAKHSRASYETSSSASWQTQLQQLKTLLQLQWKTLMDDEWQELGLPPQSTRDPGGPQAKEVSVQIPIPQLVNRAASQDSEVSGNKAGCGDGSH